MQEPVAHIALLVDFANLRLGMAQSGAASVAPEKNGDPAGARPPATRDVATSLMSYAGSLGRVGVSRAYADWSRMPVLARQLTGTRLSPVLVPATEDGEDRSHIRLTVDAVESLFNGDEPDVFVLVSGDPTLLPLVQAIRGDGSEVHIVAGEDNVADELKAECDQFVSIDDILDGTRGEPVTPRAWRTEPPAEAPKPSSNGQAEKDPARRNQSYQGPAIRDSEFDAYDWSAFITLIDELEQRLPFVGVRYLVNKVLAPHNCGISDPRIKRDLINRAVDDGLIEMYQVGNVDNRTDPVTACRLDRENEFVTDTLGDAIENEEVEELADAEPVEA